MIIVPTTQAIIDLIQANGYAVTFTTTTATAIDSQTGERYIVRGQEPYANAV